MQLKVYYFVSVHGSKARQFLRLSRSVHRQQSRSNLPCAYGCRRGRFDSLLIKYALHWLNIWILSLFAVNWDVSLDCIGDIDLPRWWCSCMFALSSIKKANKVGKRKRISASCRNKGWIRVDLWSIWAFVYTCGQLQTILARWGKAACLGCTRSS